MAERARFERTAAVLAVHDVERSQRFYVDVLGFEAVAIDAPGWRFVARGALRIDLGECPGDLSPAELGSHSYFVRVFVDDVDAYHAEIAPRGALILFGPKDQTWGLRELAVQTVDGHRLMFCAPTGE